MQNKKHTKRINSGLTFLTVGLFIIVVLSIFENQFYGFYILSHFKIQYIILSIVLILFIFLLNRKSIKKWSIQIGLLIMIVSSQLNHILKPQKTKSNNGQSIQFHESNLKVMLWNTWKQNSNYEEVYELIIEIDPNVVILQDIHPSIESNLPDKLNSYKFFSAEDNLFFVKEEPLLNVDSFRVKQFPGIKGGNVFINWNDTPISLLGIHLSAPKSSSKIEIRHKQVDALINWIENQTIPIILIGDMNTTPWSTEYKRLSIILDDSMSKFGVQPTWPFHNLFTSLIRVPLDHCFHSERINTIKRNVVDSKSSDHRPLILEFQIPKQN